MTTFRGKLCNFAPSKEALGDNPVYNHCRRRKNIKCQ